jgi:hypothetical protein
MKEIITKYLDKNYKFTLSSYISYHLVIKSNGEQIRPDDVYKTLSQIFGLSDEEIEPIYNAWGEAQAIKMENLITDIRYKIYEKTGFQLDLTVLDLNKIINLQTDNAEMSEGIMGIVNENNSMSYRDMDKL